MTKDTAKRITEIIIDDILAGMNVTDPNDIQFMDKCIRYRDTRGINVSMILVTINQFSDLRKHTLTLYEELYIPKIAALISIDNAVDAVLIIDRPNGAAVIKCTNLCDKVGSDKITLINRLNEFLSPTNVISDPTNSTDKELINITLIDELWK